MDSALRRRVLERAEFRCEYCHYPVEFAVRPFQVDHIIAEQHGGTTILDNLASACNRCNLHKGPNIASIDPTTGTMVPLFNPRTQEWGANFSWEGPRLVGITPIGRATIAVLSINSPLVIAVRRTLMEEGIFPF